jgi:hypothetical protein
LNGLTRAPTIPIPTHPSSSCRKRDWVYPRTDCACGEGGPARRPPPSTTRALSNLRPAQGVVGEKHNDSANNGDADTVKIDAGNARGAKKIE